MSDLTKGRPIPVSEVEKIAKRASPTLQKIKEICLSLDPGMAIEIDTSKITYETVRMNVKKLIELGEIPPEFKVRSIVRKRGDPRDRRCFIIRLKSEEIQWEEKRQQKS